MELDLILDVIKTRVTEILHRKLEGVYVHGSIALGGFQKSKSDIDLIIIVNQTLSLQEKHGLLSYCLSQSKNPYPIEVSVLEKSGLENWRHPSNYDFHYSEYWRDFYENTPISEVNTYLMEVHTDPDLAAHLTIVINSGLCLYGKPIGQLFHSIPKKDYLLSLQGEYNDCLKSIKEKPIYCILSLLRIEYYLIFGKIISKQQAAGWGVNGNHSHSKKLLKKIKDAYEIGENISISFEELDKLREEFHIIRSQFSNS
ncbi:aminoglycoside adenylyltransferase domain-containing protein [Oceanobacillus sp. 1P07AA]|uniref:aminoglycoside adenylyltransferase domain-containing protein n=1 Tax=Oceanobacillus sp. 1P07AA TaxID=3132293 RepID=UPI0039A6EBE0